VTELVRALAAPFGVRVLRTDVIGLLPRATLARTARYYLGQAEPAPTDASVAGRTQFC
jgi:glutamate formiminotransferase